MNMEKAKIDLMLILTNHDTALSGEADHTIYNPQTNTTEPMLAEFGIIGYEIEKHQIKKCTNGTFMKLNFRYYLNNPYQVCKGDNSMDKNPFFELFLSPHFDIKNVTHAAKFLSPFK